MFFLRTLFLALLCAAPAAAHAFNQSYIYLRILENKIEGRVEINLTDLNRAIGTKFRTDQNATDAEIEAELDKIKAYLFGRIGFALNGTKLTLTQTGHGNYKSAGFQFVSCRFTIDGITEIPDKIEVTHKLMFDVDPGHTGFVVIEHYWQQGKFDNEGLVSLTFKRSSTTQTLDLTEGSIWTGVLSLTKLGVHHILIGTDHILFLIVLLLPAVLRRNEEGRGWVAREKFTSSLWEVLKIVTVFTIAHSVTLSIAAMGWITLPARIVESIIALSIAVAALDVLFPIFRGRILWVVALFGLFHGFGFAFVLGEMGISGSKMAWSLLGFNVGVELGQIAIVLAVFPLLFMMRLSKMYSRFSIYAGALLSMFVATYWFIERAFETDLDLGERLGLGHIINFF